MAETVRLTRTPVAAPLVSQVTLLRVAIILATLAVWEFLAHSGWLYRDVVPSLMSIGRALAELLMSADYYFHLSVTGLIAGAATAVCLSRPVSAIAQSFPTS